MASRYETRTGMTVNNENALVAGKNIVLARTNSQRSVLGEIGNKAVKKHATTISDFKQVVKPNVVGRSKSVKAPLPPLLSKSAPVKVVETVPETNKVVPVKKVENVPVEVKEVEAFSNNRLNVEDIDESDGDNCQLLRVYVNDIYNYMHYLEAKFPIRKHFLEGGRVNARMRTVLVDWLVDVHFQFHFLQETLYLTVAILDRFLQVDTSITRKQLQLVGVTALFIGSKYEEMYIPEIGDFAYITDNAYTIEEIKKMEMKILRVINFQLGRPLPLHFLRRQSKAAVATPEHHTLAKYLLELSLTEYEFSHCPPSIVAASSLCLALGIVDNNKSLAELWSSTLVHYSRYNLKDIMPLVKKLAVLLSKAETSKYQAVRKKYASRKLFKISVRPELNCSLVRELAGNGVE